MLNRLPSVLSFALVLTAGIAGAADRVVMIEYFTSAG